MEPVELRSDELLLRPWRPGDAESVHRALQDPVLAYWSHRPAASPRADAERFVADMAAALVRDEVVGLGVFDAASGDLLGSVDLRGLDRGRGTAELGYWSPPWARGRRVTERAARALLGWGFGRLGLVRVDWRATVGNHASRLTGLRLGFRMIGLLPGVSGRTEEWTAALVPRDLTAPGHEVAPCVRRQAAVFGGARPTLAAGPVTLRPPDERDIAAQVAAYRDPEVVRWYGVPCDFTDADARTLLLETAPLEWARGAEAVFVVAGPGDAYAGTIDLRIDGRDPEVGEVGFALLPEMRGRGYAAAALRTLTRWGFERLGLARVQWRAEVGNEASRRVAAKAGFTMEGLLRSACTEGDRRRDCWVGSIVADEVAA